MQKLTRSTRRVQTSLAEADHYSHMPNVKMLSLGGERLTKKGFCIITCTTIWLCYRYYGVFCSFTHLRIPRSPPKFTYISSSLYYPGPLHKISLQYVHNLLRNVVHRQTVKPTIPKHNLLCQGGNYVKSKQRRKFYCTLV